jgi:colanic acid biosynthesis glycosyl transferase WcaI
VVVFDGNGGGAGLAHLQAAAAGLPNVRFVGMQPRSRLNEVLAAADVHLVPLRRGLARSSVPSKLYSILASGRPVLASVDEGTEVARTVERAGAGVAVPPDDLGAFLGGLEALLDDPARRQRCGAAGRRFVEGWASPEAIGRAYADLFAELVGAPWRGGGRAG